MDVPFTIMAAALVLMSIAFAAAITNPLSRYRGPVWIIFIYAAIGTFGGVAIFSSLQQARDLPYTIQTVTATVEVKVLKEQP